jgi:hypothetical protein
MLTNNADDGRSFYYSYPRYYFNYQRRWQRRRWSTNQLFPCWKNIAGSNGHICS